jgi:hypothetical protein
MLPTKNQICSVTLRVIFTQRSRVDHQIRPSHFPEEGLKSPRQFGIVLIMGGFDFAV